MLGDSWTGSKNTTPSGDMKLKVPIFFIHIKNNDYNNNEGISDILKPRKYKEG
jgi:hypothetical protein